MMWNGTVMISLSQVWSDLIWSKCVKLTAWRTLYFFLQLSKVNFTVCSSLFNTILLQMMFSHDGLLSSRSDDTAFGKPWCSSAKSNSAQHWTDEPQLPVNVWMCLVSAETLQSETSSPSESADHWARQWDSTSSKWPRLLEPRSSSRSFRCDYEQESCCWLTCLIVK